LKERRSGKGKEREKREGLGRFGKSWNFLTLRGGWTPLIIVVIYDVMLAISGTEMTAAMQISLVIVVQHNDTTTSASHAGCRRSLPTATCRRRSHCQVWRIVTAATGDCC